MISAACGLFSLSLAYTPQTRLLHFTKGIWKGKLRFWWSPSKQAVYKSQQL